MNNNFKTDVNSGLSSIPKTLPSKYFYNKKGDSLFVEIMNLPEYYLTDSEHDIFKNKTDELINSLEIKKEEYFELIELGAGDGSKTKELLKSLTKHKYQFDYFPIDISANALRLLKNNLEEEIPELEVKPQQGDYFDILSSLKENKKPKIILFLGSTLGNIRDEIASKFIAELGSNLMKGDKLLLGLDLIKSKDIVLPAYNDSQGVTAEFNLNLLHRINEELGANFNLNHFKHQPEYDEKEGVAKSFIVSTTNQKVQIKALQKEFNFSKNEKIHTEISRKYNDGILHEILKNTDFVIKNKILDSKEYFADYVIEKEC